MEAVIFLFFIFVTKAHSNQTLYDFYAMDSVWIVTIEKKLLTIEEIKQKTQQKEHSFVFRVLFLREGTALWFSLY